MKSQAFKTLLVITLITTSYSSFAMGARPDKTEEKETVEVKDLGKNQGNNPLFGREGFSKMVKPLLPSVVNISTSKEVKMPEMSGPDIPPDSPLGDLFKHFFKEYNKQRRPQKSRALGSGFIIDYDEKEKVAYIVTNNHIIMEAEEILVRLADEDSLELKAEVVGTDARTDIALLKVKSQNKLPTLRWGDSEKALVGEWSVAIGNPFGLGSTVTAGIISTKGRELPIADYVEGYIQTDASINMGNSGGPLFNIEGEVIGINTAILAPTGGNIGIGFAIPSAIAIKVIKQLRELGHTKRGWLGAAVQRVTKEIAESVGRDKSNGALIAKVFDKSPAKEAGLERGDIILKFNNQDVKNSHHLPRIVGETEIGKEVEVVIWRDEKEMKKILKVGEFEKAEKAGLIEMKSQAGKRMSEDGVEVMGMTLQTIDDLTKQKFNLDEKAKGVVIADIDSDSEAAHRGLEPGDVITEIGRAEVSSPEDVKKKFEEARKKNRMSILLLINRHGELRFITLGTEQVKKNPKKKQKLQKDDEEKDSEEVVKEKNSDDNELKKDDEE